MLEKMKLQVLSLACVIAAIPLQPVFAQTTSSAGTIKLIGTGWSSAVFGIGTTAPLVNPAGCATTDQYQEISANPGYNTDYAAALTAYSTGSQVEVVVSNTVCTNTRPTIIGLYVLGS